MPYHLVYPKNEATSNQYAESFLTNGKMYIHGKYIDLVAPSSSRADTINHLKAKLVSHLPNYESSAKTTNQELVTKLSTHIGLYKTYMRKKFPLLAGEQIVSEEVGHLIPSNSTEGASNLIYVRHTNLGTLGIIRKNFVDNPQTGSISASH